LLASAGVRPARITHSGKLRAQQTAELLAKACSPDHGVEAGAGLSPNDPVKPVARMVASLSVDTMLVGHLPFMGRLARRLVTATSMWTWSPLSLARCCASSRQPTIAGVWS
jgi:phosphohistidine phosphatase